MPRKYVPCDEKSSSIGGKNIFLYLGSCETHRVKFSQIQQSIFLSEVFYTITNSLRHVILAGDIDLGQSHSYKMNKNKIYFAIISSKLYFTVCIMNMQEPAVRTERLNRISRYWDGERV